jgi:hypothetical protein
MSSQPIFFPRNDVHLKDLEVTREKQEEISRSFQHIGTFYQNPRFMASMKDEDSGGG